MHMCDMTHFYMWHDSCICVWHDIFICVTWLMHMRDVTHSFICVTWLIHMCNVTHSYVWHDSFMCDMTHLYVWKEKKSTHARDKVRVVCVCVCMCVSVDACLSVYVYMHVTKKERVCVHVREREWQRYRERQRQTHTETYADLQSQCLPNGDVTCVYGGSMRLLLFFFLRNHTLIHTFLNVCTCQHTNAEFQNQKSNRSD